MKILKERARVLLWMAFSNGHGVKKTLKRLPNGLITAKIIFRLFWIVLFVKETIVQ